MKIKCNTPPVFPRYYSTLLQTLQTCDDQTVAAVRAGVLARVGPDMESFLQLVQNKACSPAPSGSAPSGSAHHNPASWRNTPIFNIQPSFAGRDPTHLFARKRSLDHLDRGAGPQADHLDRGAGPQADRLDGGAGPQADNLDRGAGPQADH